MKRRQQLIELLLQLCNAARLHDHQRAVIDLGDGNSRRAVVIRFEMQRAVRVGQAECFDAFAKQRFIAVAVLSGLRERVGDRRKGFAGCRRIRRKRNRFHAVFAVQREGLRVLRLFRGGGEISGRGRRVWRNAVGEQLAQLAICHRLRHGRGLSVHRDFTRVYGRLKGRHADRTAGGRLDEQGKRIVGEIGVGREVERRAVWIGSERRDDGSAAGRVVLRGGKGVADQRQHFFKRQSAAGQKTHQQAAVALHLGGEEHVPIRAGRGGENGQHVRQRARNAVDFVAQRVVEHRVAVAVHQHFARHGGIGIDDRNRSIALQFLCVKPQGARGSGDGCARESDAEHPCACAAHAKRPRFIGVDGGIEIKRTGRIGRRAGQRKARAACAGNQRGHAGKNVIRMRT